MFDEKKMMNELKEVYKAALRNAGITSYKMYKNCFPTDFIKRLWLFNKVKSVESLRTECYKYCNSFPLNNLDIFFIKKYNIIAEALNEKLYPESKIDEDNDYIERAKTFAPNPDISLMIRKTDSYKEALRKEKKEREHDKNKVKGLVIDLVNDVLYEVEREMR